VRTAASVEKEPNGPLAFGYEAGAEHWFDPQTTRRIAL
jgi:hypothetical protein